jgi:succinyl-diaminopimelate desuccinylase
VNRRTGARSGQADGRREAPEIAAGALYGRGAVDMKGGIACFVAAALGFLGAKKPRGTLTW